MKLGLSLAGGGIKGVAHIGAIKALEESNIKFDYISGTSSGSIVATLYSVGFTTDEIFDIFKKYIKEINYIDKKNVWKLVKNIFTNKGLKIDGLNSGEKIKELINKVCKEKGIRNINQVKMPILIPSVNIYNEDIYIFTNKVPANNHGKVKYINNIDLGTAVQASCSYPGIFSPCEFGNELLIDGGITENFPWKETKRLGADKVLSIVFESKSKKCCKDIFEVIGKSFSILCHELASYEWDGTDYLLKIKTEDVGLLDKTKMDEIYLNGYTGTKEKIEDIKLKLKLN